MGTLDPREYVPNSRQATALHRFTAISPAGIYQHLDGNGNFRNFTVPGFTADMSPQFITILVIDFTYS
jgi:hypothetical protein